MSDRLWATWRLSYIKGEAPKGCIFCDFPKTGTPRELLILGYTRHAFVIMNRFPYTNGHLMVVPTAHAAFPSHLTPEAFADLHQLLALTADTLKAAYQCHGMNIGMNIGAAAGAGIADHIHYHLVPRWAGDTNFMPVFADVRLVNQSLEDTYDHLEPLFREAGLARDPID